MPHLNHADTRHSSERLPVAISSIIIYSTKDGWKCLLSKSRCSLSGNDFIRFASSSMFTDPKEFEGNFLHQSIHVDNIMKAGRNFILGDYFPLGKILRVQLGCNHASKFILTVACQMVH